MTDLQSRFKSFDQVRAPDLWAEIQERATATTAPRGKRFPTTNRFAPIALLGAVVALLLVGVGLLVRPPNVGPQVRPNPTAVVSLPTLTDWDGKCEVIGLNAELMGDPNDPRVAWVVDTVRGRLDIVFPPGFSARFTPDLVVLDDEGRIIGVEGDHVRDGCATVLDDGVVLIPELGIRR